jgi:ketosteroid isomerase-like protein
MNRTQIDRVLRDLYAARFRGDLDGVCRLFSDEARFRVTGTGHGSPISIRARGSAQIRSWLAPMIRTFQIRDPAVISVLVDGTRAAGHWRARIHSRITGIEVMTELVDLIDFSDSDDRISCYTEFFVPC